MALATTRICIRVVRARTQIGWANAKLVSQCSIRSPPHALRPAKSAIRQARMVI